MRVVFTADARRAARALDTWWREHRDHVDLFERELDEAVEQIGATPDVHDTAAGIVRVLAVWGAARRRGPPIG